MPIHDDPFRYRKPGETYYGEEDDSNIFGFTDVSDTDLQIGGPRAGASRSQDTDVSGFGGVVTRTPPRSLEQLAAGFRSAGDSARVREAEAYGSALAPQSQNYGQAAVLGLSSILPMLAGFALAGKRGLLNGAQVGSNVTGQLASQFVSADQLQRQQSAQRAKLYGDERKEAQKEAARLEEAAVKEANDDEDEATKRAADRGDLEFRESKLDARARAEDAAQMARSRFAAEAAYRTAQFSADRADARDIAQAAREAAKPPKPTTLEQEYQFLKQAAGEEKAKEYLNTFGKPASASGGAAEERMRREAEETDIPGFERTKAVDATEARKFREQAAADRDIAYYAREMKKAGEAGGYQATSGDTYNRLRSAGSNLFAAIKKKKETGMSLTEGETRMVNAEIPELFARGDTGLLTLFANKGLGRNPSNVLDTLMSDTAASMARKGDLLGYKPTKEMMAEVSPILTARLKSGEVVRYQVIDGKKVEVP